MSATDKVEDLLKESGAVPLRDHKHYVYRLPNGNKFTRSKTPSDRRASHKDLSELRRALGMENAGNGEGERREKRPKARKAEQPLSLKPTPRMSGTLAEQLKAAGVTGRGAVTPTEREVYVRHVRRLKEERDALAEILAAERRARRHELAHYRQSLRSRFWWPFDYFLFRA